MMNVEKYLSGDQRFTDCVNRYGKEEIIDQIENHLRLSETTNVGSRSVFLTEKFIILSGVFVISLEDLELFDISVRGLYRRVCMTAGDKRGEIYSGVVWLSAEQIGKIVSAVSAEVPSLLSGIKPADQLEYKRRHTDDLPDVARVNMRNIKLRQYDYRYLEHIRNTWFIILMAFITIGMVVRIFTDAEKTSQLVGFIIVSLFFGSLTALALAARIKLERGYKAYCRENRDELLDQLNNKVIYTPDTSIRRIIFVTEKYLFLIGKCVIKREDVIMFYSYPHKSSRCFVVMDKDGRSYSTSILAEVKNWENEEVLIGSFLPNAVIGDTEENRKNCETIVR